MRPVSDFYFFQPLELNTVSFTLTLNPRIPALDALDATLLCSLGSRRVFTASKLVVYDRVQIMCEWLADICTAMA